MGRDRTGPIKAGSTGNSTRPILECTRRHFETSLAGVYKCRVMAEGQFDQGTGVHSGKTLTAGVYYGDDHRGTGSDPGELICRLLHCVFEEHEVLKSTAVKRLAELGFDMKRFIDCIEEVCPEVPQESIPGIRHKLTEAFMVRPQLVKSLKFANAVESRPIKVKPILGAKAMADIASQARAGDNVFAARPRSRRKTGSREACQTQGKEETRL